MLSVMRQRYQALYSALVQLQSIQYKLKVSMRQDYAVDEEQMHTGELKAGIPNMDLPLVANDHHWLQLTRISVVLTVRCLRLVYYCRSCKAGLMPFPNLVQTNLLTH